MGGARSGPGGAGSGERRGPGSLGEKRSPAATSGGVGERLESVSREALDDAS